MWDFLNFLDFRDFIALRDFLDLRDFLNFLDFRDFIALRDFLDLRDLHALRDFTRFLDFLDFRVDLNVYCGLPVALVALATRDTVSVRDGLSLGTDGDALEWVLIAPCES